MERARAAAVAALFAVLLAWTVALAAAPLSLRPAVLTPTAAVGWPPSTLVVSEVQTGGASASDEFAEITNAGPAAVDLAGLEVVYVTSTGGTVTRKAAWTTTLRLDPGRHLLIANGAGLFASVADATYSGGFAATGGAIVLRPIGGAPIDGVAWGDATNGFVEGTAAAAPPAGTSVERRPGGLAGNGSDTNDNLADFLNQATPNPQNLAAPPAPAPIQTASPAPPPTAPPSTEPTSTPTAEPQPSTEPTLTPAPWPTGSATTEPSPSPTGSTLPSPVPSAEPTPTPTMTPAPTVEPSASPIPSGTPAPTSSAAPTPTATPAPTATPVDTPTPGPSAGTIAVADARRLADGVAVTIEGTLTTDLGALEAGRSGFVQDATAGIAVYLEAALAPPFQAGFTVRLAGTLDTRYGARTLRVAPTAVIDLGPGLLPAPDEIATGGVGEVVEGQRVTVAGRTSGSPTGYADGLGILVDDGTGQVRVIVGPEALVGASIPSGTLVRATGPVGQRDSTGVGTGGYRIHATEPGELELLPAPTPDPTPTPEPTPAESPAPGPSQTPNPDPTGIPAPSPTAAPPTPTPTPSPAPTASTAPSLTITEARARPIGSSVVVTGVVTAEAGRLGVPPLLAIGDATAGIVVRLPDGAVSPARGTLVSVSGSLAAPYGQLEIRPALAGLRPIGSGPLPVATPIVAAELGERTEAALVTLTGTVTRNPRRAASGDLAIDVVDVSGRAFRVMADASSGLRAADIRSGNSYRLLGIVGQRASKKGALDGYRLWLRDRADVLIASSGPAGSGPSTSADSSSSPVLAIAAARRLDDAPAAVEGTVTAGAGLLDAQGRLIVIQDATGGIAVLLPAGTAAPSTGTRVRVEGTVGRALDAPRLRASAVTLLASAQDVTARALSGGPGEALEWQLVRIVGTITDVTRLGDRWRADVSAGGDTVLVTGLSGSGIASTSLVEGRRVTVVGIVRRPHPSATDRRWTIIPRGPWDLAVGPAADGGGTTRVGSGRAAVADLRGRRPGVSPGAGYSAVPTVDLAVLVEHVGARVRVGGIVDARTPAGFTLDDGTAIGTVQLQGDAAAFLALIEAGDALGVVGVVEVGSGGEAVVVASDPGGLVRLGSLGEAIPLAVDAPPSATAGGAVNPVVSAGLADPIPELDGSWFGAAGLVLVSACSLLVTAVRRRRARLRLVSVVAARIAGLRRTSGSA